MSNRKPTPKNILAEVMDGAPTVARETPSANAIHMIPLAKIKDNPFQTRITTDPAHILKLAQSIYDLKADLPATLGLQQPPMARIGFDLRDGFQELLPSAIDFAGGIGAALKRNDVVVQLMFGHSRYRAFELLAYGDSSQSEIDSDYETMPILISAADDRAMWTHAVTENAARKDISGVEEAHSLRRAMDEFGLTTGEAAKPFGWQRSTAANKLRLLQLPDAVQDGIVTGTISEKHGRLLLRLASAPVLLQMAYDHTIDAEVGTRDLSEKIDMIIEEQPEPNGWPRDWDPGDGATNGACDGCTELVQLDGRDACISPACYALKRDLWSAENEQRQIAAARAALDAAGQADVEILTFGRRWLDDDTNPLGMCYDAPAELVDGGHCDAEKCECFAACYINDLSIWSSDLPIQPDPDNAPDVVACCTNADNLKAKKEEMNQANVDPDEARLQEEAKQRQVAAKQANKRAARKYIDNAVRKIGGPEKLWANREFLIEAALPFLGWNESASRKKFSTATIEEITAALIDGIIERTGYYNQDVGARTVNVDEIQALANRIAPPSTGSGDGSQPGPGESQETDWRDGWDHGHDEGEYVALGDYWSVDEITRSRVALRLIDDDADPDLRPALWRRHGELVAAQVT